MKTKCSVLLTVLALAIPATIHAADKTSAHDHHAHESSGPQQLQLNAGKKWTTDAPLRQAMSDINQAMAKAVPLIHADRFGEGEYRTLATTVGQKVAYAVEHCKLDPKADAMLHLVIAELMAGAETMEGKTGAARHDGAVQVLKALEAYGKHFQHPSWKTARG